MQGMTFWQMINQGGVTVYVLFLLSVISLAIIFERSWLYYHSSRIKYPELMGMLRGEILRKAFARAREICSSVNNASARVVAAGLEVQEHGRIYVTSAMERRITQEASRLERRIGIVGSIGSTSVYVGLFGTVLGIVKAFQDISEKGSGGISVVMNGIAEALVCTAVGLLVAIPAVIAYNSFVKKIDDQVKDMELSASEMIDLLDGKGHV